MAAERQKREPAVMTRQIGLLSFPGLTQLDLTERSRSSSGSARTRLSPDVADAALAAAVQAGPVSRGLDRFARGR